MKVDTADNNNNNENEQYTSSCVECDYDAQDCNELKTHKLSKHEGGPVIIAATNQIVLAQPNSTSSQVGSDKVTAVGPSKQNRFPFENNLQQTSGFLSKCT